MKILHTADWHIGQFKGPVVDGVNLRLQDTVKCLEYMVEVAQKEKPDIVCISGDIFHQEQIGPVRYSDEMIIATDTITKLADIAKGVIVMRGTPNHDGSGQFRVLDRMFVKTSHVHIITAPTVLHTPYTDIACIPGFDKQEFRAKFPGLSADEENLAWTKYISDMVFALRAECEKTPILMAHYTVPGCNMESGQTSFFTNFEPVIPREALMAARYEAVLLGHIHRPQIIEGIDNVFYSGAINAMNFNDEGQERGFWIHEFNEKGTLVKGHRYTTPYRQFHTITWDPDEVGDYIREGAMYLHRTGISEEVTDKIVRVRYSCTSEQKKALNIPLLQKNLYELGAFYVADIEAESTIDITNRGLLSEESDPRLNLKKWLEEKTFKNPDKIVELAEPIIAETMKQSTTAEIHGVFKPVSISVRNYRNYKEENFDFSDISFCTINGVNGAGKSSLFMDAIVDCLFEETRDLDYKLCETALMELFATHTYPPQIWISVNDPACGAGATLIAAANIFHRKKINYQTQVLFTANDVDRVVAQMCYIQLSLLGCPGWVAVANTISNPVCGDPLMPDERPGQEFWYTPFYFREEWNYRRQIQIFKEIRGSWIIPIGEHNPGKITFYFDFEKGEYKCQNS